MSPSISDRPDDSQHDARVTPVTPIGIPPRGELWRRIRLAQSMLSHRPLTQQTRQLVVDILDGWVPE